MKKLFLLLPVLFLILNSCKKEEKSTVQNYYAFNPHDDRAVEQRIKNFNKKIENYLNGLKTNEYYTLDDAVWEIEAALNYNFCISDLKQNFTFYDSLIQTCSILNNKITSTDVFNFYIACTKKIEKIKLNKDFHMVAVDVSYKNNNSQLKATFVISDDKIQNNQSKDTYYTTAATIIKNYINNNLPGGYYYTDIVEIDITPIFYEPTSYNPDWNQQYFNYYRYLMFVNNYCEPLFHYYLSDEELNFYKTKTATFLNTYTTNGGPRPINKYIVNCNIFGDIIPSMPCYYILHRGTCKYGIPHIPNE